MGFDDVKISVKASNVPLMIEAYRQLSEVTDHPLHLGVTEAGPPPAGTIKGTAGIGTLLSEGIGDTIRYSLTADPVEEAKAGRVLLESLGLRERTNVDLIACPACGRAEIDVYKVAQEAQAALEGKEIPLQVAVMGCVVNGPGEARSADLGIAAGRHRGHLFIQGQIVRVVPEDEMVAALVEEAEKLVKEGVAARLAAADSGRGRRGRSGPGRPARRQGRRRQPQRGAGRADRPPPARRHRRRRHWRRRRQHRLTAGAGSGLRPSPEILVPGRVETSRLGSWTSKYGHCSPGRRSAFVHSERVPFLDPATDDGESRRADERAAAHLETDRAWVAVDRGRFVGNAHIYSLDLTLPAAPGQPAPVRPFAGVSGVGVHPTHRRRGLLRRLMAVMLDDARRRGEAFAGLSLPSPSSTVVSVSATPPRPRS